MGHKSQIYQSVCLSVYLSINTADYSSASDSMDHIISYTEEYCNTLVHLIIGFYLVRLAINSSFFLPYLLYKI